MVDGGAVRVGRPGPHGELPANIRPFLAMILALMVAAHSPTGSLAPRRRLLPAARRPAQRHRVRVDRPPRQKPRRAPGHLDLLGIAGYAATLLVVRRCTSSGLPLQTFKVITAACCSCRWSERRQDQRGPHLGGHRSDQLPASEFAKIVALFLRRLPGGAASPRHGHVARRTVGRLSPDTSVLCSSPGWGWPHRVHRRRTWLSAQRHPVRARCRSAPSERATWPSGRCCSPPAPRLGRRLEGQVRGGVDLVSTCGQRPAGQGSQPRAACARHLRGG